MKIELKSLNLINFKGIRQLMVKCNHETSISGDNATGKTTVFDAFLWLLFGKDSTDRKDFGIKTLDDTGKAIPMIDHEVIGQLLIDDRSLILRRVYKEIWRKPRGQAEEVFSGHETTYYADGVPCSQKEYQDKVDSVCKEAIFKLLTNPEYFPNLNWTIQRQSLFSLISTVSFPEIIEAIPAKTKKQGKFDELLNILTGNQTIEEYKKKIASEKKTINDELVLIPARIDEVLRGKPEPEDWAALEKLIEEAGTFIQGKEEEKSNKLSSVDSETTKRAGIQAQINSKKQTLRDMKVEKEDQIRADNLKKQRAVQQIRDDILTNESVIKRNSNNLAGLRLDLESLQGERQRLLKEWQDINSEQYTHVVPGTCPTCGQELPEDFQEKTKQENLTTWNSHKQAKLETNTKKGKSIAGQIKQKEQDVEGLIKTNEILQQNIDALNKQEQESDQTYIKVEGAEEILMTANAQYQKLSGEITALQKQLTDLGPITPVDVTDLNKWILVMRSKMDENRTKLAKREIITKADTRKAELEASQKTMAQKIAEIEQMEFTIETYLFTKVRMLEERINSLFSLVKFKMFNTLINGGLEETCECSVNGVPYSDLNGAAKINAGLDIIRTMSRYHDIIAPVFIDNAESTNEFIPMECQIVKLFVIPPPPKEKEKRDEYIKFYEAKGTLLMK